MENDQKNEELARRVLEKARWLEHGAVCPNCGSAKVSESSAPSGRQRFRCNERHCRRDIFTVSTGTFMHGTHLPYVKWLATIELVLAGVSANQIGKRLNVPYKTAWLMHRRTKVAIDSLDLIRNGESLRISSNFRKYSQAAAKWI